MIFFTLSTSKDCIFTSSSSALSGKMEKAMDIELFTEQLERQLEGSNEMDRLNLMLSMTSG